MRFACSLASIVALLVVAFSVSRADAKITFRKTFSLSVNAGTPGPQAIALVDLNFPKDNRADILVVDNTTDTVQVFMNDGSGGFPTDPTTTAGTGQGPHAIATGDFNNDGIVDFVTVNDVDFVTIRLGDGSGNFNSPHDYGVDPGAVGVAVGDFNNDGNMDLAVLSDSTIHLLKGHGDGTFEDFPNFSISTGRHNTSGGFAIVTAKMNRDAYPDLVVSSEGTNNISVLLGIGDVNGTFQLPNVFRTGSGPEGIAVTDLDGDNVNDVAVVDAGESTDNNVSLLYGNGDGTLKAEIITTAEVSSVAATWADFDSDGKNDLAITNIDNGLGIWVLRNDPSNQDPQSQNGFAPVVLTSFSNSVAIQAGEINGDGMPDMIALSDDGGTIGVFINTTGQVQPTTPPSQTSATPTPPVSFTPTPILPTSTPSLTPTPPPTATPTPIPTAPYGECNTNDSGQPVVAGQPVAVAIGDFNHDGKQDIAVADKQGNRIAVLLSNIDSRGAGACGVLGLQPGDGAPDITAPVAMATVDLDGDGQLDLAVVGADGLSVLIGDGAGGFVPSIDSPMAAGTTPQAVAIADFNRDGKPDIIVANKDSNDVSIFFNLGDGSFDLPCQVAVGRSATFVAARDLNQDGRPDFAVASQQINDVVIFLQTAPSLTPTPGTAPTCANGPVSFTSLSPVQVGQPPQGITFDNFDPTNSIPDYAVATSSGTSGNGSVQVFLRSSPSSEGSGGNPVAVPMPATGTSPSLPSAIGSGDINGDTHPDLIVTDANNNDVVVYLANSDGSFTKALIPFAIRGRNPVAVAVKDIDGDGVPDIVTANQGGGGSVSILVSSRPPPTPTPLPTDTPTTTGTPTQTGAPTDTPTPTPTTTATPTITGTRLPTSTPFPSRTPTPTLKPGTIGLQGSCAVDPVAGRHDWSWAMLSAIWVSGGFIWRRRRTRRSVR